MGDTDLHLLSDDIVHELNPGARGEELADWKAAARREADNLVSSTSTNLTEQDIRQHLRHYLRDKGVEPGEAERMARLRWYQDLCFEWILALATEEMTDSDLIAAINMAISDAEVQMAEHRWPTGRAGRDRLHWILRQAVSQRKARLARRIKPDPG